VAESLLAREGDLVQEGQVLGKVVPTPAALEVSSFLSERHRAFVKVGDSVKLELDQLPYQEFGTLTGTVKRVSSSFASSQEMAESIGEPSREGPFFRVDVAIDMDKRPEVRSGLGPGMLLHVRFHLRERPLIAYALDRLPFEARN
jgi:multidrug efflux pump subunit AcrA (membrane-fusion protein)